MQVIGYDPVPGNFSDAFNRGLQQLVQLKLNKLQHRQDMGDVSKAFQALGIPQEKAQAFASLPKEIQTEFIRSGLMSSLQAQPTPVPGGAQTGLEQIVMQPQQPSAIEQQLLQQPSKQQAPAGFSNEAIAQRVLGPLMQQQQQAKAPMAQTQPNVIQQTPQAEKNVVAPTPLMTTKERAEQIKTQREADKQARLEQHAIEKKLEPYIEDLDKKGGVNAKFTDVTLNQLEKLIDSGNLTGPAMYNFRKKLEEHGGALGAGLGGALGTLGGAVAGSTLPGVGTVGGALAGSSLGANLGKGIGELIGQKFVGSKEDQEFTKLTLGSFLPKMKDIFGARVAIQEMQVFMDSIPSLSQTDEGKRAIIKNMRLTNDAWKYIKKTKDRIIAENGGKIPYDLKARIDKATDPYLNKLAEQFQTNIPPELTMATV